jgi:sugar phosphate isomerase/epimerase
MVHVKDYTKDGRYVLCGQGDLNWTDALAALSEVGYQDALIIETPPDYGRQGQDIPAGLEAARTSLAWLKGFMGRPVSSS